MTCRPHKIVPTLSNEELLQLLHLGHYQVIGEKIPLDSPILASPSTNLILTRALQAQGRYHEASTTAGRVDWRTSGTAGDVLLHVLERLRIEILRFDDQLSLVSVAETFVAFVDVTCVEKGDWVEAQYMLARMQLTASVAFLRVGDRCYARAKRQYADRMKEAISGLGEESSARRYLAMEAQLLLAMSEPVEASCNRLHALSREFLQADSPVLAARALLALGEKRRQTSCSREEIEQPLKRARQLFDAAGHGHGRIDADRQLALVTMERLGSSVTTLNGVISAYEAISYYSGMLGALRDASTFAHTNGENNVAKQFLERSIALAETCGMGVARSLHRLTIASLYQRSAMFSEAIRVCRESMHNKLIVSYCRKLLDKQTKEDNQLPEFGFLASHTARLPGIQSVNQAQFKLLTASAYASVNDTQMTLLYGVTAWLEFEACGAIEQTSNVIVVMANQLGSMSSERNCECARNMLAVWIEKDVSADRRDDAIGKLLLRGHIFVNQARRAELGSRQRRDFLQSALADYEQAEAELPSLLDTKKKVSKRAELLQLRAVVFEMQGEHDLTRSSWYEAHSLCRAQNMQYHAANCCYILGVMALNAVNTTPLGKLLHALNNARALLLDAARFYQGTAMRRELGNTHYMLALLFYKASIKLSKPCYDWDALKFLDHAAETYDDIRREFGIHDDVRQTQRAKQNFVAESRRVYCLKFTILFSYKRADDVWSVVQHAKARSLTDIVGLGRRVFTRFLEAATSEARGVLQQERDLAARVSRRQLEERGPLLDELRAVYQKMNEDAYLKQYIEACSGSTIDGSSLQDMQMADGSTWTAIDWTVFDEGIFVLIKSSRSPVFVERLQMTRRIARETIKDAMDDEALIYEPERWQRLNELIRPLEHATREGDLLVLSPSDCLHRVPFHALELSGRLLIERNPVVYTMSLSLLRYARLRQDKGGASKRRRLVAFGDPSRDRRKALESVERLASEFGFHSLIGEGVNLQSFADHSKGASHIHFNGHAIFSPQNPMQSHLKLYGMEVLTASEVFDLRGIDAELVTLAACESGANEINIGDEPLGLIPSFHFAGASAILATLWKSDEAATADVMSCFYSLILSERCPMDKARALQHAMLQLRKNRNFKSPYFWAPYVLHGDWRTVTERCDLDIQRCTFCGCTW